MIPYLTVSETNKHTLQSAYQICFCRELTLTWHLCAPSISLWSESVSQFKENKDSSGVIISALVTSVTVWFSNYRFFDTGLQETRN